MATDFEHVQEFNGTAHEVMAMLGDRGFIEQKCARTGSLKTDVDITEDNDGGVTLTIVRVLPAEVPSVAKKFVGDTITVSEVQKWTALGPDGSASATGTVEFSAPLTFTARVELTPGAKATVVTTSGSFKAGIPFVGGTIEASAAEMTSKYLDLEQSVGNEWLAGEGHRH